MNEKKLEVVRPSTVDHSVFGDDLKLENAALRERLKDLDGQIQRLQSSRLIAPHEEEANAAMAKQFYEQNKEQNRIAKYLRDAYAVEIERGDHSGLTFADVILKYLRRERAAGWLGRFIGRVFGGAA